MCDALVGEKDVLVVFDLSDVLTERASGKQGLIPHGVVYAIDSLSHMTEHFRSELEKGLRKEIDLVYEGIRPLTLRVEVTRMSHFLVPTLRYIVRLEREGRVLGVSNEFETSKAHAEQKTIKKANYMLPSAYFYSYDYNGSVASSSVVSYTTFSIDDGTLPEESFDKVAGQVGKETAKFVKKQLKKGEKEAQVVSLCSVPQRYALLSPYYPL